MTKDELENLYNLERKATAGPWYVCQLDDEMCMGAIAVTTTPEVASNLSMRRGNWPGYDVVAACLIQSPPYAIIEDDKFQENAELIAAVRNALPDLLRLAKLWLDESGDT
jgi:hypothetical protein